MSHSIGVPGFVFERRHDLLLLKRRRSALLSRQLVPIVRFKRNGVVRYRTRSYKSYKRSRNMKETRRQKGQKIASVHNRKLHRRQRRYPGVLQNSFDSTSFYPSKQSSDIQYLSKRARVSLDSSFLPSEHNETPVRVTSVLRLNTHLWHAKRMVMIKESGWVIPQRSSGRAIKTLERVLEERCVLQDASYYMCRHITDPTDGHVIKNSSMMKLIGPKDSVIAVCRRFMDPQVELHRFEALKETEIMFYSNKQFPMGLIGPVMLLNVPVGNVCAYCQQSSSDAQIWISCHPSIVNSIYKELLSVVNGSVNESGSDADLTANSDDEQQNSSNSCRVILSKAFLNRLRIRGAGAAKCLASLLSVIGPRKGQSMTKNEKKLKKLKSLLQKPIQPKDWKDGAVITVNITDPRIRNMKDFTSPQNDDALSVESERRDNSNFFLCENCSEDIENMRKTCTQKMALFNFRSDHEINKLKLDRKLTEWEHNFRSVVQTHSLPTASSGRDGDVVDVNRTIAMESSMKTTDIISSSSNSSSSLSVYSSNICPLAIVRKSFPAKSFKNRLRRFDGFDLLVPDAWTGVIFRALHNAHILNNNRNTEPNRKYDHIGAIAVGSEEMDFLHARSGLPSFPRDYIDTCVGRQYWSNLQSQLCAINSKRPTQKKLEFNSLSSIFSKFTTDEGKSETENMDIASDRFKDLIIVRGERYLRDFRPPEYSDLHDSSSPNEPFSVYRAKSGECDENYDELVPVLPASLPPLMMLQVLLIPTGKGLVFDRAMIFAPSEEDIKLFLIHKLNNKLRKMSKSKPQQTLREAMDSDEGPACDTTLSNVWKGVTIDSKFTERDGQRPLIGVVTTGQQRHSNNIHFAVGVCGVRALNLQFHMAFGKFNHPQAHLLVLFRNERSRWLRPAVIQII